MAGISKCAGETLSYKSDAIELPQGATWSATCRAVLGGEPIVIDAVLVKIGPSSTMDRDDYTLTLYAPSTRTATWNAPGGDIKAGVAEISIGDNSSPPVVIVTHRLSIEIRAPLA